MTDYSGFQNQVAIPADYFYKMSLMDYNTPHEALVREFFQNSVDAGAKVFIAFFDDENQEITFVDDGCGMDEDVIRNRLLVMGGSFKRDGNAIGDFGHAKILIYFSWQRYEIHTNNLRVRGKANLYSIERVDPDESICGTASKITVENQNDYMKIKSSVENYFSGCCTEVKVILVHQGEDGTIETRKAHQNLKPVIPIPMNSDVFDVFIGNESAEDDAGSSLNSYICVRTHGVLMFRRYCSSLKKSVIVETKLRASELFTQNRDAFKRDYQEEFSGLLNKLSNDNISTVSADFQTFIAETRATPKEKPHKDRGQIELLPSFFTLGKTRKSAERYFLKKRATRMKLFVERLVALLKERSGVQAEIDCGFVFEDSIEGLTCHSYGGQHVLYVNPLKIEELIQNKHQMAYKIWDMVIHEFSHIWSYVEDGNQCHNESFVLKNHRSRDLIWDQREIQTIFAECWKAVK